MKNFKNLMLKFGALFLCISILYVSIGNQEIVNMVRTIKGENYNSSNYNRISDSNTMDSYKELLLSDENGSRYAGRIWSDKSVLTNDLTLDMDTDGYNGKVKLNADFLNVFSTLGSSQAWIGLPPTKTVIVIDNSASMYGNNKTWNLTRMDKTIRAVNKSIDTLMRSGAFNEVAVVLFGQGRINGELVESSNTASVIVPMGHYEVSADESTPYNYLDAGWQTVNTGETVESPIKDSSKANTGSGFVFVDKRYVNSSFEVDDSIKTTDKGFKRYDIYQNGTTNVNAGTHLAFKTLLDEETSIKVAGINFNYIPSVVVLSDGAATDLLSGPWYNPTFKDVGFTNDRGNRKANFIKRFEDPQNKYTYDWNMFIDLIDKNGTPTLEQVGYGDGKLSTDGNNPGVLGEEKLKVFADEVRSTHASIILTTLLNSSYMKSAVEKKFHEECKFFTISVDMSNPEDIKLPNDGEWFSGTASYNISTGFVIMDPNNYFNLKWLQEKGYIKESSDLDNLTENDLVYEPYSFGAQVILGINDAIKAYGEFKNNSSSFTYRNKINTYVSYNEAKGLWADMNDGSATINDQTYKATVPIGYSHNNAYLINGRTPMTFENLNPEDKDVNPYGLSNSDIDFNYVTKAYYTTTGNDVSDSISETFDQIVKDIVSTAFKPISGINDIGIEDSMTYMDPLGQYTEIKSNSITIDGNTYDMGLLLFGKVYGITRTAIYDYNFNATHRGEDHKSNDLSLPFEMGWYDKDGNFLGESGSWENGDTYYVSSDIVRKYVPNLLEEGKMTDQQKKTIYTLYRFLDNNRNDDIHNPCYKDTNVNYKLSDIRIWVEDTENFETEDNDAAIDLGFDQALYVNIPVSALPIEVANIEIGSDGRVSSYSTNLDNKINTTPFRLFYGVGLQDSVFTDDGLDIDMGKISREYLKKNKVGDIVYFYSNYYSNTTYTDYVTDTSEERTRGDALLSFSPNSENRFYMYQNPLPLYNLNEDDSDLEENGTYKDVPLLDDASLNAFISSHQKITDASTLDSNKWYYVILDYYLPDKKDPVHVAVSRLGKEFGSGIAGGSIEAGNYLAWYNEDSDSWIQFEPTAAKPEDGNWVIATRPGGLRVGDMAQSLRAKSSNKTGTAYNSYLPTISRTSGSSSNDSDVIINSYLGNNGRIEVNDSLLFVTKELETSEYGEQKVDKNKEFSFSMKMDNREGDFEVLKMYKNPYSNEWQLRISTIDVLTDNRGLLQNSNNNLTVYRKNNRSYYIYIGINKVKRSIDDNVFRLYSAPDNEDGVELTQSGITTYVENPDTIDSNLKTELNKYKKYDDDHTLGSIDFWVKKAYLIPVSEVENNKWSGSTEGYASLDEFVISHLNSYLFGSSELSSPYATNSSFLTQKVYFGYSDDNKPEIKPDDWDQNDWDNQTPNVAQFKLKGNEGLMFTGLKSGQSYEIEENITTTDQQEGYFFDHINLKEKDKGTISGRKVVGDVNANYPDEIDYFNKFLAPVDLTLSKKVVGSNGDTNKAWNFELIFNNEEVESLANKYSVVSSSIDGVESPNIDYIDITKDEDGNYKANISLKHGQKITIKNLPYGTNYEVIEKEANENNYVTTSKNAKGVLKDEEAFVEFENSNYLKSDFTLSKEVLGALGDKEKDWTFEIKLTPKEGSPFAQSYSFVGSKTGSIEFMDNHDGSYTGTITLKHNESITIKDILEDTKYEIVEQDADKNGYITLKENAEGTTNGKDSVNAKFTNIKYSRHDLTLEKIVTGGAGDKSKDWHFKIVLIPDEDVIFDKSYHYVGGHVANGVDPHSDGELVLTDNHDGSYEGEITLKHGESVTIEGIPERTQYKVIEQEANKNDYYTMQTTNSEGVLTKENEKIRFTNYKLSKHDITLAKKVEGAWGDKEKEWTFKITLEPLEYVILDKDYSYVGSKIGKISFADNGNGIYVGVVTLKHGETITIKDLPEGTHYNVEELEANQDGYTTRVDGPNKGTLNVNENKDSIIFTNIKQSQHSLTIYKEVRGSDADKSKEWNFVVKLTPEDGVKLLDSYPIIGGNTESTIAPVSDLRVELKHNSDGTSEANIKLKHGQSLTISELPEGTKYEVIEKEANEDGYITWTEGTSRGVLVNDASFMVKFVNKKPAKYSLTINKEVLGGAGDKEKEWTFEITLTPDDHIALLNEYLYDGDKTGLIEFVKQPDGSSKGSITLKHGQTINIKGLPENTNYSIQEKEANKDGYITNSSGNERDILSKNTNVSYKNIKLSKHDLVIRKFVNGNLGEKDKEWHFKITFESPKEKQLDSEYVYELSTITDETSKTTGKIKLNKVGNKYESNIILHHGEEITLKDLPEGTHYKVEEIEANQDNYITIIENNAEGILENKIHEVNFYNNKYSTHNLTIKKELKGSNTESNREWHFKVILTPNSDVPFSTSYAYTDSEQDGILNFTLKDDNSYECEVSLKGNQQIIIKDIPYGTSYEVIELEANQDNYHTVYIDNKGIVEDNIETVVSNERNINIPETNDSIMKFIIIFSLTIISSFIGIVLEKRLN